MNFYSQDCSQKLFKRCCVLWMSGIMKIKSSLEENTYFTIRQIILYKSMLS